MKTKIISILALLLTMTQGAWAQTNTHASEGYIEVLSGQNGSIHIHGWARDQDCPNTPIDVDIYVFSNSDGTGQVLAPITTKANGSHPDVGNHAFSTEVELPNTTQTTYYVRAWALETNSAGQRLGGGCQMTIAAQSSATIHAVTVNAPFAVTYNANEGTGAPSTQYKRTSFNLTLSSTQPTRTGYTFAGWNTADDGSGNAYAAGATYSANADVTLYAQWTSNTTTSGIDWNPSANSGTFLMPAYNVEVSTELWYKVDEEKTLDENIAAYGEKDDFFLNRTLTANVWNTFASPFAIAAGDMEKYFGAGAKVRQLNTTSVDGTVLTLNFTDATSIDAGKPYLVKPAANVDFSADGKEFAGVNLTAASATATTTTYVNFVPTLGVTLVEGNVKDILILNTSGTLVHPTATGNMKGFRAYFKMHDAPANAREFIMNFGDGETTGIQPIRMENGTTPAEGTYDLSGRRIQGQPTQKGVYIQNGKKVVIK